MKKLLLVVLSVVLAATLSACGGGGVLGPADVSGRWLLNYTNTANNNVTGTFTLDIGQDGTSLSGTMYLEGYAVGNHTGSISGNSVNLTVSVYSTYDGGTFRIRGNVSGDSWSGNYSASGGGEGPVNGQRISSSTSTSQGRGTVDVDISRFMSGE